jgi:hypothetical protein
VINTLVIKRTAAHGYTQLLTFMFLLVVATRERGSWRHTAGVIGDGGPRRADTRCVPDTGGFIGVGARLRRWSGNAPLSKVAPKAAQHSSTSGETRAVPWGGLGALCLQILLTLLSPQLLHSLASPSALLSAAWSLCASKRRAFPFASPAALH